MVVGDELRQVGKLPSAPGKLDCEKPLFTREPEARLESPRLEVGPAAHYRTACEEPENAWPRKLSAFERARGHHKAGRILILQLPHKNASSCEPEPRMAREDLLGTRERARRPPRVVVGQGNQLRSGELDADCPSRRSAVLAELHEFDAREGFAYRVRGTVSRAVVDDHDLGPLG